MAYFHNSPSHSHISPLLNKDASGFGVATKSIKSSKVKRGLFYTCRRRWCAFELQPNAAGRDQHLSSQRRLRRSPLTRTRAVSVIPMLCDSVVRGFRMAIRLGKVQRCAFIAVLCIHFGDEVLHEDAGGDGVAICNRSVQRCRYSYILMSKLFRT